jgi:hypothetical protein
MHVCHAVHTVYMPPPAVPAGHGLLWRLVLVVQHLPAGVKTIQAPAAAQGLGFYRGFYTMQKPTTLATAEKRRLNHVFKHALKIAPSIFRSTPGRLGCARARVRPSQKEAA